MSAYSIPSMREMRLKGKTLAYIGKYYGLTRERVRQILVENYGSSIETDPLLRIEKEIKDYQWDSASADADARNIAKRIRAIFHPIRVNPNDPLSVLVK